MPPTHAPFSIGIPCRSTPLSSQGLQRAGPLTGLVPKSAPQCPRGRFRVSGSSRPHLRLPHFQQGTRAPSGARSFDFLPPNPPTFSASRGPFPLWGRGCPLLSEAGPTSSTEFHLGFSHPGRLGASSLTCILSHSFSPGPFLPAFQHIAHLFHQRNQAFSLEPISLLQLPSSWFPTGHTSLSERAAHSGCLHSASA